ncbi:hypothetical protein [Halioxenophilus aromaticivorans]|uniref:Uncharacterized protein n=1 Tax=Halioxenophilus aromaticivorans TaxID=1306992 RepID=A0AAV3TXA4_9ALTE
MSISYTSVVNQRLALAKALLDQEPSANKTAVLAGYYSVVELLGCALNNYLQEVNQQVGSVSVGAGGSLPASIADLEQFSQEGSVIPQLVELASLARTQGSWLQRLITAYDALKTHPIALQAEDAEEGQARSAASPTVSEPSGMVLIAKESGAGVTPVSPEQVGSGKYFLSQQQCQQFYQACYEMVQRHRENYHEF